MSDQLELFDPPVVTDDLGTPDEVIQHDGNYSGMAAKVAGKKG